MKSDSEWLPAWVTSVLAIQAGLLWAFSIAVHVFFQEGWATLLRIPRSIIAPGTVAAAATLTAITVFVWAFRRSSRLLAAYAWARGVAATRIVLLPIAVCVIATAWLWAHEWDGMVLLGYVFALTAYSLYRTGGWSRDSGTALRLQMVLPAIAITAGLGFRLWLVGVDNIWTDEGFHISASIGMMLGKAIAPATMHFPDHVIIPPWRGIAFGFYGIWARLVGVGLLQQRLLAYLFAAMALLLICGAASLWYGHHAGIATAGVASLTVLLLHSTVGRGDSIPLFAVAASTLIYAFAVHKSNPAWHIAVGAVVALSLEAHFGLALFLVAFGLAYFFDYFKLVSRTRRVIQPAPLWYYLLGAVPFAILYLILHIALLPSEGAIARTADVFLPDGNLLLWRLTTGWQRITQFWSFAPFDVLLIAGGTIGALIRRTESDWRWIILMASTQIAYVMLGAEVSVSHTIYGLPIFILPVGALFAPTDLRAVRVSDWAISYTAICLGLSAVLIQTINLRARDRTYWDNIYAPIVAEIMEEVPRDEAIIAPPQIIARLPGYRRFLHTYYPGAARGPALAGIAPEVYWQSVILEEWPLARVETFPQPNAEIRTHASYMAARQAIELVPHLWIVNDGGITELEPRTADSDLQVVAYQFLPQHACAGDKGEFNTLWVSRSSISERYLSTIILRTEQEAIVVTERLPIRSGWAGSTTDMWGAAEFHNVQYHLALPSTLESATYTVWLEIGNDAASPMECAPNCEVVIGQIEVRSTQDCKES